MISLQNQRVMERFFELASFPAIVPAQRMEMNRIPLRLLLEWQEDRLLMSLLLTVESGTEQRLLEKVLEFCQPEYTLGIPLRAFVLPSILGLTASTPVNAGAEEIFALYQQQYLLLQRYSGGHIN